jgi:hypothetical protein
MYEGAVENARHDGATDSDEVTSQSDEVTGQSDETSGQGHQHEHQDVSEETPPNTFESQDGASEDNGECPIPYGCPSDHSKVRKECL